MLDLHNCYTFNMQNETRELASTLISSGYGEG